MPVALSVRDLTVEYGGLVANDGVTLEVAAGTVVGLIGPNGAGKSTFVDAVSGFVPYRGTVALNGRSVDGLAPHRRARLGLTRTWQSAELFTDLSVRANVEVAHVTVTPWSFLRDLVSPRAPRDGDRIDVILDTLGLRDVQHSLPAELSLGQRKRLGVARALAGSPVVTLLDEPAAGLDLTERRELGQQIRVLAETGFGVLLIEHDVDMVLSICDSVVVLDFGAVIASGSPESVRRDPRVAEAYLGDRAVEVVSL
jgi:branched-chain amino acid transport system ATP-binding protein